MMLDQVRITLIRQPTCPHLPVWTRSAYRMLLVGCYWRAHSCSHKDFSTGWCHWVILFRFGRCSYLFIFYWPLAECWLPPTLPGKHGNWSKHVIYTAVIVVNSQYFSWPAAWFSCRRQPCRSWTWLLHRRWQVTRGLDQQALKWRSGGYAPL